LNKKLISQELNLITTAVNEIEEINRNKRIAWRKYYLKMEAYALPREEALKWIRRIKKQSKDGKIDYR